ncbi:MAG TPA: hypothetical protein VGD54_15320 [Steroidobacteraceae bacterium]
MMDVNIIPLLARALALSHDMLAAVEQGRLDSLGSLDAERLELLKSFRLEAKQLDAGSRALLQQITQLNGQTIGLLEHQLRGKGREIDMAAVGRRAVAAYSAVRLQRLAL